MLRLGKRRNKMKKIIGVLLILPLAILPVGGIIVALIDMGILFEITILFVLMIMAIVGLNILWE